MDNICYTGEGALKSGNHTQKQYLAVMDKNEKKRCAVQFKSLKCKSCNKSKEISSKEIIKQLKAQSKNKTYKISKKTEEKIVKQMSKCDRCKNNKTKKCDLKKYIEYSGARVGKCEDSEKV